MEKQIVTKQQAIEDFKRMFNIGNEKSNTCTGDYFMIDKLHFTRQEVVQKLAEYFDKYRIDNHHVIIHPITLVWTTFEIESNQMINHKKLE